MAVSKSKSTRYLIESGYGILAELTLIFGISNLKYFCVKPTQKDFSALKFPSAEIHVTVRDI